MPQTFTDWFSWQTPTGRFVRVVVAAGVAVAGGLIWIDRPTANYPTAADEAAIMARLLQSHAALLSTGEVGAVDMENAGAYFSDGAGGFINTTNAVGYYPSRRFYYSTLPTKLRTMAAIEQPRFVDLWGTADGNSGANKLNEQPYSDRPDLILDDEPMNTLAWWQTNIYTDAAQYGDLEFHGSNYWYLTTNILTQSARPLSAMRWTQHRFDPPAIDEDFDTEAIWVGTSVWYLVSAAAWATALSDAADNLLAAPIFTGNTNGLGETVLSEHFVRVQRERADIGGNYSERAILTETAQSLWQWDGLGYAVLEWIPNGTNIASVAEFGIFTNAVSTSVDQKIFYHPFAVQGTWQRLFLAPRDRDGVRYYRGQIYKFQERLDIREYDGYETLTNATVGWGTRFNDPATDFRFVVDWTFHTLTNPAPFFGTSYGIR